MTCSDATKFALGDWQMKIQTMQTYYFAGCQHELESGTKL